MLHHRLGDYVTLGGRVAVRDHVTIASKVWVQKLIIRMCTDDSVFLYWCYSLIVINSGWFQVRLAANSCVTKDIKEPGDYGGFPAVSVVSVHYIVTFFLVVINCYF